MILLPFFKTSIGSDFEKIAPSPPSRCGEVLVSYENREIGSLRIKLRIKPVWIFLLPFQLQGCMNLVAQRALRSSDQYLLTGF